MKYFFAMLLTFVGSANAAETGKILYTLDGYQSSTNDTDQLVDLALNSKEQKVLLLTARSSSSQIEFGNQNHYKLVYVNLQAPGETKVVALAEYYDYRLTSYDDFAVLEKRTRDSRALYAYRFDGLEPVDLEERDNQDYDSPYTIEIFSNSENNDIVIVRHKSLNSSKAIQVRILDKTTFKERKKFTHYLPENFKYDVHAYLSYSNIQYFDNANTPAETYVVDTKTGGVQVYKDDQTNHFSRVSETLMIKTIDKSDGFDFSLISLPDASSSPVMPGALLSPNADTFSRYSIRQPAVGFMSYFSYENDGAFVNRLFDIKSFRLVHTATASTSEHHPLYSFLNPKFNVFCIRDYVREYSQDEKCFNLSDSRFAFSIPERAHAREIHPPRFHQDLGLYVAYEYFEGDDDLQTGVGHNRIRIYDLASGKNIFEQLNVQGEMRFDRKTVVGVVHGCEDDPAPGDACYLPNLTLRAWSLQ